MNATNRWRANMQHTQRRRLASGTVALVLAATAAAALTPEPAAAADAPRCVPAELNRSDVLAGLPIAVSPLPGTYAASTATQISMLGAPPASLKIASVTGSHTGAHSGRLLAYSQGDGASFLPSHPFAAGETVTVRGSVAAKRFQFSFTVAVPDTGIVTPPPVKTPEDYIEKQHFASAPTLEPPQVVVDADSPQATSGDVFSAPYSGPGPSGPMIFNEAGQLVWFDPLAGDLEATNLQVQQLGSQPVLTWWQGTITLEGFGQGEEIVDNNAYRQIGRVHAGNGLKADLHDFHLTAQGTALLTAFHPIACNLTGYGGPADGDVTDGIVQEVDLATGLVRREWHSLDHISPAVSYSSAYQANPEWPFDYFHPNSVDQLAAGSPLGAVTLISSRNASALYEVNTQTGQVLATIGGRYSTVKLAPGVSTAFQHDATVLEDGTISVFDNGALPKVHPQSRALVLAIDQQTNTASLVAQYEHSKPLLAGSQGSVQVQANGNVFVGWGAEPFFSEFSASGQVLFDAHMHGSYESYRAYRFPWTGAPTQRPAIAVRAAHGNAPEIVYASWNGDTRTASWRVLGGHSARSLLAVTGAPRSGFETAISVRSQDSYVAIQALSAAGAVLGTSPTIHR